MAAPKLVTPMNFNASPQTGIGDGGGTAYQAWGAKDKGSSVITVQAAGAWNSATLKFELCLDDTVSPLVWTAAQGKKDDGTMTDVSLTADGTCEISVRQGVWVRPILSGSDSPLPALKVDFYGDFANQS